MQPSAVQRIKDFSKHKSGFGKADRFLYVKMMKRLQACDDNLGPDAYESLENFKRLTATPCISVMVGILFLSLHQISF